MSFLGETGRSLHMIGLGGGTPSFHRNKQIRWVKSYAFNDGGQM